MLHHNLEQEAEEYFRQLYNEYPLALKAYETIFHFTEESLTDALTWLQCNAVSYIAVQIIIQGEHIIPDQQFYSYLNIIYPGAADGQS